MRYTVASTFRVAKSGKGLTAGYGAIITQDELGLTHKIPFRIWVGMKDGKASAPRAMVSAHAEYNGGVSSISPQVETNDAFSVVERSIPVAKMLGMVMAAGDDVELTLDKELNEISRRTLNIVTADTGDALTKLANKFMAQATVVAAPAQSAADQKSDIQKKLAGLVGKK